MDTLNLHSNFDNLLYIGRSVLNNTSSHIQKLFFKKEMCIYEYLYKEEVSKGIEIKIDVVVLVCALEHDKCNKSILYFNDVANIARYIHYCNSNFEYKEELNGWIMSDSYLALSISEDDYEKRFAFIQTLL